MEDCTMKLKALLLLAMTIPALTHSMNREQLLRYGEWNAKSITGTLICYALAVAGHEFGHAIAGKLLFNSPINIHLGHNINETSKPVFSIGPVHIHGLPLLGQARINIEAVPETHEEKVSRKVRDIGVDAAGPLMGLATGLAVHTVLEKLGFGSIYSFIVPFCELSNFLPVNIRGAKSDGTLIWETIKQLKKLFAEKAVDKSMRKQ